MKGFIRVFFLSVLFVISAVTLALFSGCSSFQGKVQTTPTASTDVPVVQESHAPVVAPVDPLYLEDYETFWTIVEENFSALSVAERITGKNFDEVKEKYASKLGLIKNTQDFYNSIIMPCIAEFNGVGHMFIVTKDEYHQWYESWATMLEEYSEPKTKYNFDILNTPAALDFYEYVTVSTTTYNDKRFDNVTATSLSARAQPKDNLVLQFYPDESIAMVTIYKMTLANENNDSEELEAFFEQIEREGYQHCVLDIRFNGGGSDLYWRENIVMPNISKDIEWDRRQGDGSFVLDTEPFVVQ